MDIKKIDEYSVEVTEQAPTPQPVKKTYTDRAVLEKQVKTFQAEWNAEIDAVNARRQVQMDGVKNVLAGMDELGVQARPEIKPEINPIAEEVLL